MMFCGVFDGHGPWGHYVAKKVLKSLPSSLLCNWQESLALASLVADKKLCNFDLWKQAYLRACGVVDKELEHDRSLDSFHSGTTALTIVKQVITNYSELCHSKEATSVCFLFLSWSLVRHLMLIARGSTPIHHFSMDWNLSGDFFRALFV